MAVELGEINLYFNIIESIISVEADSTISFMQTISEKPSTTFSNSAKQT